MALPHRIPDNQTQDNFDKLDLRVSALEARTTGIVVALAELGLKIVRGVCATAGSGSITEGSGFTIAARNGPGDLTLTINPAFSDVPAVTNNAIYGAGLDSFTVSRTASSIRIAIFDAATGATGTDGTFDFIAIGPR